ncbi:zinc finger protein 669-like [Pseudoliparis swirei]|uniref:zinc finger protein 669-like n=1 Tax=Pseudoliparis swirei TaxID=2059687 RepID=UPI0024BDFCDC|nr:zinc finger protein 669-like [Pseudoliparis swirei]XP_056299415.1 zinc finger protein 669-like [Pseudoliparis swirei]XP_056299416.1 zinc finger protein 669-like [Pseudoliparis swirei]
MASPPPADPSSAVRPEDDLSAPRRLSVCLVDCMTFPGLVEVELKEEAFRSERRLRLHGRSEHRDGTRERSHASARCDKSFYLWNTLRQHRLTHSGEKTVTCERCGKSCARKGDLKTHMLSHSREGPHACGRCGAAFKQPAKLKQHEQLHTGRSRTGARSAPRASGSTRRWRRTASRTPGRNPSSATCAPRPSVAGAT